ncbi:MAG: ATP-binding protein, partial [Actinomycetes bacterium]
MVLHGLTERELSRTGGTGLIEVAMRGDIGRLRLPRSVPDIDGYVEHAMRSGFPEAALRLGPMGRQEWLDAYLEHVVSRDVRAAG